MKRFINAVLVAAVMGGVLSACVSKKPDPTRTPAPECQGEAVLVVHNHSGLEIEVVEARRLSGRHVVAVVGPGRHEIPARPEAEIGYTVQAVGGGPSLRTQRLNPTGRSSVPIDNISLKKVCRDPVATDPEEDFPVPEQPKRPKVLTPEHELGGAAFIDIEVPQAGYLTVFELRPGVGAAMAFPHRGAVSVSGDGSIGDFDPDVALVEKGLIRITRPPKGRDTPSGNIRTTNSAWGLDDFSYSCRPGPAQGERTATRWLLVVWSSEALSFGDLWAGRDEACAVQGAEEQALAVVEKVGGLEPPRPWLVELVRY